MVRIYCLVAIPVFNTKFLVERSFSPFFWLLAATFCFALGMALFLTISTNFMVEELGIRPEQLGLLESIREVPGLLAVVSGAMVMMVAEPLVGLVALFLLGFGYLNYFHVQSIETLIVFSVIGSVGFHLWWPVSNTIALRLSATDIQGRRLGQIRSVAAVAQLVGIGIVALAVAGIGIRPLFIVSGSIVVLGGLMVFRIRGLNRVQNTSRLVLRRRYWLYYALTFLDGGRRHIFMTFAIFLLVRDHAVDVQTIAVLGLVNGVVTVGGAYVFGRLIDGIGERPVLMVSFGALALIFTGYATISSLTVLFALYVLDNFFFSAEIGVTTYLRKILIDPSDLRPSLVVGLTMNHVAAVVVPVTGGILWKAFGHQVPFLGGAILAVLAMVLSVLVSDAPDKRPIPDAVLKTR